MTERKEDDWVESDAFTHGKYPSVTVTTYRRANGRIGFQLMGENPDDLKAVEQEMMQILDKTGAKVGNRREMTFPRSEGVEK